MWNGIFMPRTTKADVAGIHSSNPLIEVGNVEFGEAEITVFFNHTCTWEGGAHEEPPSNAIGYTFNYQLEGFGEEADEEAADLQLELDRLHEAGRSIEWLHDNLESGKITRQESMTINGKTVWF